MAQYKVTAIQGSAQQLCVRRYAVGMRGVSPHQLDLSTATVRRTVADLGLAWARFVQEAMATRPQTLLLKYGAHR